MVLEGLEDVEMVLRAGKGFEVVGKGIYPLILNRFIRLGKGKKGNYPRFCKKTAHNRVVTNLDNFCDRIFNGVGRLGG